MCLKAGDADTIVFDKTGTLTYANPKVRQVIPFNGNSEQESLRLAACLEEHYPHSIANAVVEEAKRRGLDHEEKHSKVEYVIAHGIASSIDGKKAIIGSYHFVFEDEKCVVPEQEKEKSDHLPQDCSLLYMAIGGVLAAVICIDDPVRPEAADVIKTLHEIGFSKIVMMTGDNEAAARSIARQVGVDEYHAGVLPEDKALFVQKEKEQGKTVMMIGDGINDSPALSEADVGIAISTGAAIAREISDIMITTEDLVALVQLKRLSDALMKRIDENYRFIIGFNSLLILSGVAGILQPTTSALLHNISTIAIGLRSTTNLIKEA
jgi:P-type E1-E2 ATPase